MKAQHNFDMETWDGSYKNGKTVDQSFSQAQMQKS